MTKWLAVFGFVLVGFSEAAAAENVVNLASIEYPPYTGELLKHRGMITQIVQEAYAKTGFQVNIRYYPWARATQIVKRGDTDGLLPIWMREDRKEWLLYSSPMPASEIVFYKQKGVEIEFDGQDYLALKSYKIGTGRDYANPVGFEEVREQLHVELVTEDIQNLGKLATGRLDLVIIDKYLAQYLVSNRMPESVDDFDWVRPSLSMEPNHVGISRKTPDAQLKLDGFNRGLAILEKEGRIQAIVKEHGFKE